MSNALTSVWRFILPAGVFGKYGGGAARSILFLACAFAFGSMASRTWVQEVYAQIKGVVTDPTGAAVPDGQVTATNTQTNAVKTVSTEGNGSFQFLQRPVGSYSITVTKTGFRSFTETGITLALNQVYNLPVELSVGQISQSLEVQAGAAQIETNTTQLQTVIEGDKIVDLPLNGRNSTQLQQLVPGVVASSDTNRSNYATNGSQSEQNSFLLNGTDNIELPLNEPSIIPSPDAITEFNLITSTNPEYGRNSGAVLNAIIKSGTNGAKFYV